MPLDKVELIIHPVRLRILQVLAGDELTTQEIAERLPDVPKSSLYRHLRLLLDGEMIGLAETRLVHGIQEKVYELAQPPYVGPEEMAALTVDEHFRYFTTYVLTLLRGFASYLNRAGSASETGTVDLAADYVGYTETAFFAGEEELAAFAQGLHEVLSLLPQEPGPGRARHKLAVITHPLPTRDESQHVTPDSGLSRNRQ